MSKKPKILIAEDEPSMRLYIQTILSRWDCDLAVEQTGADAISRAATLKPDMALLGLTPGMDRVQCGITLSKASPGMRIVLWNEPVAPHVLNDLKVLGFDFRTLLVPFSEEELRAVCFPSHQQTK